MFFKSLDTLTSQIYERFKNFHSNFKKFVCLQPEIYEKVGSSDMLKELIELYKDDTDSSFFFFYSEFVLYSEIVFSAMRWSSTTFHCALNRHCC